MDTQNSDERFTHASAAVLPTPAPPSWDGAPWALLTCSLVMSSGATPSTIAFPLAFPFFPLLLGAFVWRREDGVSTGQLYLRVSLWLTDCSHSQVYFRVSLWLTAHMGIWGRNTCLESWPLLFAQCWLEHLPRGYHYTDPPINTPVEGRGSQCIWRSTKEEIFLFSEGKEKENTSNSLTPGYKTKQIKGEGGGVNKVLFKLPMIVHQSEGYFLLAKGGFFFLIIFFHMVLYTQTWWCMTIISTIGSLRQGHLWLYNKSEASL